MTKNVISFLITVIALTTSILGLSLLVKPLRVFAGTAACTTKFKSTEINVVTNGATTYFSFFGCKDLAQKKVAATKIKAKCTGKVCVAAFRPANESELRSKVGAPANAKYTSDKGNSNFSWTKEYRYVNASQSMYGNKPYIKKITSSIYFFRAVGKRQQKEEKLRFACPQEIEKRAYSSKYNNGCGATNDAAKTGDNVILNKEKCIATLKTLSTNNREVFFIDSPECKKYNSTKYVSEISQTIKKIENYLKPRAKIWKKKATTDSVILNYRAAKGKNDYVLTTVDIQIRDRDGKLVKSVSRDGATTGTIEVGGLRANTKYTAAMTCYYEIHEDTTIIIKKQAPFTTKKSHPVKSATPAKNGTAKTSGGTTTPEAPATITGSVTGSVTSAHAKYKAKLSEYSLPNYY